MSTNSQFHSEVRTLILTGSGETQQDALNQVLAKMRREVNQSIQGSILFIAPVNVDILRRSVHTKTERFLGLLWPRVRHQSELEVKIEVEIRWLQFLMPDNEEV